MAHDVHATAVVCPVAPYLPAAQALPMHPVCAGTLVYCPDGQAVQGAGNERPLPLYRPAWQANMAFTVVVMGCGVVLAGAHDINSAHVVVTKV